MFNKIIISLQLISLESQYIVHLGKKVAQYKKNGILREHLTLAHLGILLFIGSLIHCQINATDFPKKKKKHDNVQFLNIGVKNLKIPYSGTFLPSE